MKTPDKGSLDEWLDKALQQYGNAEPGIGLESRILANLEAAGKHAFFGYSLRWLLASGSAAALLLGIWFGIWHRPQVTPDGEPAQPMAQVAERVLPKITPAVRPRPTPKKSALARQNTLALQSARGPKLDHFPSSRSLSEQELLLSKYAERFPAEARLIAEEQDKFQQEIQQAEQELKNPSEQQER